MIRRAVVVAAVLVLPLVTEPASAHESDPGVVAVIDSIEPPLPPGVTVQVATSIATQLVVSNPTDVPLEALDADGRVFLRISSSGVAADLDSRAWRESNSPTGRVRLPTATPPSYAASTARGLAPVSVGSSWGWFDHRIHPGRFFVPERVRARRVRAELDRWAVPLRYGGISVTVRGHVEFRPVLGRLVTAITSGALPTGITAATVDGRVPAVFLRNDTAGEVVVMDTGGGRFASIGADGVLVMERSQVHVEDQRIKGRDLGLEPRSGEGIRVSAASSYTWFDPRVRVPDEKVPDIVLRSGSPTVLSRWTIPVVVGGDRLEVAGTTTWMPLTEQERGSLAGDDKPFRPGWLGLLAVPAAVVVGLALMRRRATYHRADGKG